MQTESGTQDVRSANVEGLDGQAASSATNRDVVFCYVSPQQLLSHRANQEDNRQFFYHKDALAGSVLQQRSNRVERIAKDLFCHVSYPAKLLKSISIVKSHIKI